MYLKKIFKQAILIATILMFILNSCAGEPIIPDTSDNNHEERTIVLSVGQATDTRSINIPETPQIEHDCYLDFQTGFLFLVDENNNIVQHYTIDNYSDVVSVDATTRRIHRSLFARTYPNHGAPLVLPSVSHRVRNVVIIGNPAEGLTISTTGNINTIVANTFSIMTQQNPLSVNLFGRTNGLTQTPSGDRYILTGNLTIGTSVARFEILSIASDCTDIERFTIDGIFIDNHFQTARIDLTGMDVWNAGSMNEVLYTQGSTRFPIHSWFVNGVGSSPDAGNNNLPTARPATASNAWGYQVFAHSGEATPPPGIVIRLRNVVLRPDATPLTDTHRFLTVRGFTLPNGDALENIDPGHVYRIWNLTFDRSNLSPIPNENLLSARVDVIVGQWQGEDIAWDRPLPPPPGIGPPTDTTDPGVDIGGTVWATRNVNTPGTFVDNPEDFGMFYQWGRDIPWLTTGNAPVSVPAGAQWETSSFQLSFATHWNNGAGPCPDGWRLPNRADFTGLYNSGNPVWAMSWKETNVNGYVFGTAPNQIFMPAAGHRFTNGLLNISIEGAGGRGWYWTVGDGRQVSETDALTMSYGSTIPGFQSSNRANGFTVRCVRVN